MTELQKEIIEETVYTIGSKSHADKALLDGKINTLCSMDIDDATDEILVSFSDLLTSKKIAREDVFKQIDHLCHLNPKYPTFDTLKARLDWIKAMNMEHPQLPLSLNHNLIITAFDKFNQLLGLNFDAYYTGGLMGYLATSKPLERYHSDLDLFFNEEQLITLKKLVDSSPDFKFVSNLGHKQEKGHEYKITYRDTPISIGLFLFHRENDGRITYRDYHYQDDILLVDEEHFSKPYTFLSFSDEVKIHNGIPYHMMSLESIYHSKYDGRPKDQYDAQIISPYVDMSIVHRIDEEDKQSYQVTNQDVKHSIIQELEELIFSGKEKRIS